ETIHAEPECRGGLEVRVIAPGRTAVARGNGDADALGCRLLGAFEDGQVAGGALGSFAAAKADIQDADRVVVECAEDGVEEPGREIAVRGGVEVQGGARSKSASDFVV